MNIVTKAAASIAPASDDADTETGAFDVILSAQTLDRDGDVLSKDEWKMPLPDHIVFDTDHGMSVATTVGSGAPFINDDGDLQVRGTYSSIPRAQEVRTLVKEGHIRTTSVAFMTTKTAKSNGGKAERELLNGAFVAIPSNRDAKVLSSKSVDGIEIVDTTPFTDEELTFALEQRGYIVTPELSDTSDESATDADTKSADTDSAAAIAAAELKSAEEVELRARALKITLQSFEL